MQGQNQSLSQGIARDAAILPIKKDAAIKNGRSRDVGGRLTVRWSGVALPDISETWQDATIADSSQNSSQNAPVKNRRSFREVFSKFVDQFVADCALAATAAHPEIYILLTENDTIPDQSLERSQDRRRDAVRDARRDHGAPQLAPVPASVAPAPRDAGLHRLPPPRQTVRAPMARSAATEEARIGAGYWEVEEIEFPSLFRWLRAKIDLLRAKMRHARMVREGTETLRSMNDHLLRDIGLSRHDIE